jgi:diguanylate cyclase (GGDEF)-like protein
MTFNAEEVNWVNFILLTGLATAAQLFKSEAPYYQVYHPSLVFFFAGILILQPIGFVALVVVAHLVEWGKERLVNKQNMRAWYLQLFNTSMHIILGALARMLFLAINPNYDVFVTIRALIGAGVVACVYVALNHLMVGEALILTRAVAWKESGVLDIENLATDFVLAMYGFVSAILMTLNPWLILPAFAPLYLINRSLEVPQLKQRANSDPKTGLWNGRYFIQSLESEINRSSRYDRPLTVVVADLDYLRNINNAFGHLGGDEVLTGVADILKSHFREYDIVARFGGEEFAILLPETTPEMALERIDTVRKAIENAEFEAPMTKLKINTTMSFGIAGIEGDDPSAGKIIHCADLAVYAAKIEGRNRIRLYSPDLENFIGRPLVNAVNNKS